MSILEIRQDNKRAWVEFDIETVESVAESIEKGYFVGKDVEMVTITAPYGGQNNIKHPVPVWKEQLKLKLQHGIIGKEDYDFFLSRYEAWKQGQEMPLDGTPIKGWGVISPAQQKHLISLRITTVESLAGINDEGRSRIGMGGLDLKRKAEAWLAQLQDKGPLTQQMSAVQKENDVLKIQVDTLTKQMQTLMASMKIVGGQAAAPEPDPLSAESLLEEDEPPKRGPGRPKKEG